MLRDVLALPLAAYSLTLVDKVLARHGSRRVDQDQIRRQLQKRRENCGWTSLRRYTVWEQKQRPTTAKLSWM